MRSRINAVANSAGPRLRPQISPELATVHPVHQKGIKGQSVNKFSDQYTGHIRKASITHTLKIPHTLVGVMFKLLVFAFSVASAPLVLAACTDPSRPTELCCRSYQTYSSSEYLLKNVCGIIVSDESIYMGEACTPVPVGGW